MAETSIEWADYTWNPWRGCSKVSEGCKFCYAEAMSKRNPSVLGIWGDSGTRVIASESYWKQPLKWDRQAKADGVRRKVFCASLADVFEDRPELIEPRLRLWSLIDHTPNLDWLFLTKRPQHLTNAWQHQHNQEMLPWERNPWKNVWLGTSLENQEAADERILHLVETRTAMRFLSCEPLLGPIDLRPFFFTTADHARCWVIVGGESGPNARPCELAWIRSIVQQCRAASVPCFVKQLGAQPVFDRDEATRYLRDKKGGNPEEWAPDLRVRQWPGCTQES